jgi:hypothetical protein
MDVNGHKWAAWLLGGETLQTKGLVRCGVWANRQFGDENKGLVARVLPTELPVLLAATAFERLARWIPAIEVV